MAKRHFLMLAKKYTPGMPIGNFYASEKLDGMRCFWDGGVTRGMLCRGVPFANTEKDARYLKPPISTGLWTRYGKSVQAPSWWLDALPKFPLDGELYAGRGKFQFLMSTVKDLNPSTDWQKVKYKIFDMPPPSVIFENGEINETNFKKKFVDIPQKLPSLPEWPFNGLPNFHTVYNWMVNNLQDVHLQKMLSPKSATAELEEMLSKITEQGGEGVMLRSPTSNWIPNRVGTMLKVKALNDAEGTIVGFVSGRETDLGSKLLGLMGAVILDFNGKRLELSGFTDAERTFLGLGTEWATQNPGKEVPNWVQCVIGKRGDKLTFQYRELSVDGIPKEARYWRKRDE